MTNNELREIIDKHSANNAQSDLISRADAIEAFENKVSIEGEDNAYKFGLYVQGVMDKIKALPSAEADWIPCSEKMPSDDEYVIVSVLDDHGDTPWKYTTVAWHCNGVWILDNDILCGTAIAWMPLPMPYREESEVEE